MFLKEIALALLARPRKTRHGTARLKRAQNDGNRRAPGTTPAPSVDTPRSDARTKHRAGRRPRRVCVCALKAPLSFARGVCGAKGPALASPRGPRSSPPSFCSWLFISLRLSSFASSLFWLLCFVCFSLLCFQRSLRLALAPSSRTSSRWWPRAGSSSFSLVG
jgi:hypothetical protein